MFEKEARERVKRKIYNFIVSDLGVSQIITGQTCETVEGMPHFYQYSLEKMWQEGAEFGYNKANEWHFVKDGDLPKHEVNVLVLYNVQCIDIAHYNYDYKEWHFIDSIVRDVIAWKEIVLPKEN